MFEIGDDKASIKGLFALDTNSGAIAGSIEGGVEVDAHVNTVFTVGDETFFDCSVFIDILPGVSSLYSDSMVVDSRTRCTWTGPWVGSSWLKNSNSSKKDILSAP